MRFKVLVVDDDMFMRKILRNLLAKFDCEVTEAADGVQALAMIASESPDLVFLDLNLPVLNGLETLMEIRSSPAHRHLPVVAVSSYSKRPLVMRLIELGIAGFVMKPLRATETIRRLESIFLNLRRAAEQRAAIAAEAAPAQQRLLLVEHDPNFRRFAVPFLESRFQVLEAETGAAALQAFSDQRPEVVLIDEAIQLLNAPRLVQLIQEMQPASPPRIFLLSEGREAATELLPGVEGILRKSFIPDLFAAEVERIVEAGDSAVTEVRSFVRDRLRAELITAVQHSIGVLMSQDAVALNSAQPAEIGEAVRVRVELTAPEQGEGIAIEFFADALDVQQMGSKILGMPVEVETGAAEAASEFVNTVAGQVRGSLALTGIRLDQGAAVLELNAGASATLARELSLPFETSAGERFGVAISVLEGGARPDAPSAGSPLPRYATA